MNINGNAFKIYTFDTLETFKKRVAASFETLPQYLTFSPNLESLHQKGNVKVVNELNVVRNMSTLDFPQDKINYKVLNREEAEKWFVTTNSILASTGGTQLLDFLKNVKMINTSKVWEERSTFLSKFTNQLLSLKKEVAESFRLYEDFETVPLVSASEFELALSQFNVEFDISNITIQELFDRLALTKFVPFATMNEFYKIYKGFVPEDEWRTLEISGAILLKVDCTEEDSNHKSFTNVALTMRSNKLLATMDMFVGSKFVSRTSFMRRVLDVFPEISDRNVTMIVERRNVGYFALPFQTLLVPVWAELTMNDIYFNTFMAIDESIRASKQKQNVYAHMLNTSDVMSFSLTKTERANMYGMEMEGTLYVRVRIKSERIEDSLKYRDVLRKLFTLYNREKFKVLRDYRRYIPGFLETDERELKEKPQRLEKMNVRTIAPEIFLPNYSRTCLNRPRIVTEETANEYKSIGKSIMKFPIYGESIPRYYVCDHPKHPHPGLRENTLANNEKFPYVPCCYSKNQDANKKSKYYYYFNKGITNNKKQIAVQDVFVTGRILPPGFVGILPQNMKELFAFADSDPRIQFAKLGINKNNNSFLEAVMVAINYDQIKFLDSSSRIPLVERKRKEIATLANATAAKQELYDVSVKDILKLLKESNLDATHFSHVLEQVFDCNIFVFSGSEKNMNGSLTIPRHDVYYVKFKPTRQTLFVYQTELSRGNFHSELIVQMYTDRPKILEYANTSFGPNDQIVKNIWGVFEDMNATFVNGNILPSRSLPRLPPLVSQMLDAHGKCRMINVKHGSSTISIITDPLPPFNVVDTNASFRTNVSTILDFSQKYSVTLEKQHVLEGVVREVDGKMDKSGIFLKFLCEDNVQIPDLPIQRISKPMEPIVKKFNEDSKIAKMLVQYSLYAMSIHLHENGHVTPMLERDFSDFLKRRFVIVPDYGYENVRFSSTFSSNSGLLSGGKIIVSSREMLVRLGYVLRLFQNTHFEELVSYRTKTHVPDFYESVSDFEVKSFQIVLSDLSKIPENFGKPVFEATDKILIEKEGPYFFLNKLFGYKTLYLARNVKDLNEAIAELRYWTDSPNGNVDVYSYVSQDEITNITKVNDPLQGCVLGYLLEGSPKYTIIMKM